MSELMELCVASLNGRIEKHPSTFWYKVEFGFFDCKNSKYVWKSNTIIVSFKNFSAVIQDWQAIFVPCEIVKIAEELQCKRTML